MSGTTAAFGWTYPTSTDLVKDGATAIETLADGIDLSLKRHGCYLRRTTTQTIVTNTSTEIAFTTGNAVEVIDTDAYHSFSVTPNRMVVPAGLAGVYSVTAYVRWGPTEPLTQPLALICVNDVAVVRATGPFAGYSSINPKWTGYLAVGDYVTLRVYQQSGGNRDCDGVTSGTTLDPLAPTIQMWRTGGPA